MFAIKHDLRRRARGTRMGTSSDPVAMLAAIRARNPNSRKVRVTAAIPAPALAMALRDSGETRELVLTGVRYSRADMCQVLEALSVSDALRVLDLSGADLDDETLLDVADLVRHSKSLARLDLSGNDVAPEVAEELGNALHAHPSMRTLILRDVDLRDDGTEALLGALTPAGCTLHKLVLSDNGITDQGCAMVAGFARKNTELTTVIAGGNALPRDVAASIAASCERNIARIGYNPASRPASMVASRQATAGGGSRRKSGGAYVPHGALPDLGLLVHLESGVQLPMLSMLLHCDDGL